MKLRPWKTISSKYLSQSPWISLRSESCETADGHSIDPYFVVEMPDWVHIVALTDSGEVLTTRQYRHALGKVCWEIPCGEIDAADTSPEAAAKRELLEETGYRSDDWRNLGEMFPNPARQTNKYHTFLALGAKKVAEPNLDLAEEMCHETHSIEQLLTAIASGEFNQGIHIASLLQAFMALGIVSRSEPE